MKRIVIVGAGLAGHRGAQALRRDGFDGELVLVGDEAYEPYDRPPLSKQVLAGEMEEASVIFPSAELNVSSQLGAAATGLDPARQVVLVGDREVAYDGLLIATGRRARPWPELPDLPGFHMLRGLDDSRAFSAAVRPGVRVVIVGAGFIGCEVAATIRGLGVEEVTVVDIAPYPMPVLGPEVGPRAMRIHEQHGVSFRLASGVASFEGSDEGRVSAVVLTDGERVPADVVLLALGSMPNSGWLADSGLTLVRGNVLCDEYCFAVGVEHVVAAGDIAAYPHSLAPAPVVIEHWSNAREMGAVAAQNLVAAHAGEGPKAFAPVPTFWSDQYDVKIKSAGLLSVADRWVVVEEALGAEKPALVVEAYRGAELVGAVGFNKPRAVIDYQKRLTAELVAS
jgi:NADPH-dependent 2,4-dienoyl-CoA reductase/sulfur reductase-like enzyme